MALCVDGADDDCPLSVLRTGTFRIGGHQSNNLYVVDEHGTEYYVGTLFRARYGKTVAGRLNQAVRE